MSFEYGLITKDIEEKKIVAVLNKKLHCYFEEMAAERYNLYKSYKFSKTRNRHGKSYNPKYIPWDYEYNYMFFHKQYGIYVELYPNTNDIGEQKFKSQGVIWNLYINETGYYVNETGIVVHGNNPDIKCFIEFFLKDVPFDVVLLYEYNQGEDRL